MPLSENDQLNLEVEIARARAKAAQDAAANPAVLPDVGKSALSGFANSASGLIEDVSPIARIASLLQDLGATPGGGVIDKYLTSLQPRKIMQDVAPGTMNYQTQTTPGHYARAISEGMAYLPMGGSNLARSALSSIAGSTAGEVLAEKMKGGPLEGFARFLGNVIGGGALSGKPTTPRPGFQAGKLAADMPSEADQSIFKSQAYRDWLAQTKRPAANGAQLTVAPRSDELQAMTRFMYHTMNDAGVKYDANSWSALPRIINNKLRAAQMRPDVEQYRPAFVEVNALLRRSGQSPDFMDLEAKSQELGNRIREAAKAGRASEAKALGIVKDELDNFQINAPLVSNTPMPPEQLALMRSMSRDLGLRNLKNRYVQQALIAAEDDPNGIISGINSEFKKLIKNKSTKKLFNPQERIMLRDVAGGYSPFSILGHFGLDFGKNAGMNARNAATLIGYGPAGYLASFGGPIGLGFLGTLGVGGTIAKAFEPMAKRGSAHIAAAAIRSGELDTAAVKAQRARNEAIMRELMSGVQGVTEGDQGQEPLMGHPPGG